MSSFRTLLARLAVAGSLLLTPALVHAAPDPQATTATTTATAPISRPSLSADAVEALGREEDESLAQQRASGEDWSSSEIVMVVLLLIFLFPIGLIVLIVLLIVKA